MSSRLTAHVHLEAEVSEENPQFIDVIGVITDTDEGFEKYQLTRKEATLLAKQLIQALGDQ